MVEAASDRQAFDAATGVRNAELELKNVMVTMILYREKEADPKKEEQRRKKLVKYQYTLILRRALQRPMPKP